MKTFGNNEVYIKMFGPMQVENQYGVAAESKRPTQTWTILKYLMVHCDRSVYMKEMLADVWDCGEEDGYNSFRVRLKRLRDSLKPIHLEGRDGLIQEDSGLFYLNPACAIQTDVDRFVVLMQRIHETSVEAPEGLALCEEALNLYRGEFLGQVQGEWMQDLQEKYRNEFLYLVQTTLERTRQLQNLTAIPILNSRVAALITDEAISKEIVDLTSQIEASRSSEYAAEDATQVAEKKPRTGLKIENEKGNSQGVTQVKLFGQMELSNQFGMIKELPASGAQNWLFLKYLFVHREREVNVAEIEKIVWTKNNAEKIEVAVRVAANRLRKMLKPLQLDGTKGLIAMKGGFYRLNSVCRLQTDEEQFLALVDQIRCTDVKKRKGLDLCVRALQLFRGTYLEHTQEHIWLVQRREKLNAELCFLIHTTLERMEALGDHSAISLVCNRAAVVVPEKEQLHNEIFQFILQRKLLDSLVEYMKQLVAHQKEQTYDTMQASEELGAGKTWDDLDEDTVAINPFGAVVLKTKHGTVTEGAKQSPEVWALLKYLLTHRGLKVTEEQLRQDFLPEDFAGDVKNTLKIRSRRVNGMLEPLGLDKTRRMVQCKDNVYEINPNLTLYMAENWFKAQMHTIRTLPNDDSDGLNTCVRALALYRGPYMQYTQDAEWLVKERHYYCDEFEALARNTLERMKVLGDVGAVGLLGRRVAKLMPKDREFHQELIAFMMEHNRYAELKVFIAALVKNQEE